MFISSIEGNRQRLDGGAMFGNAPRPMWEKWTSPDAVGRIELACRALLIECKGSVILCETGIGAFFEPKLAERYGVQTPDQHLLLQNLKAIGVDQSDVTHVILSHLHFDHAGGLLVPYAEACKNGNRLLFDRAIYVVGQRAWDRARNPHLRDRASFIPELNKLLVESGRLHIVPDQGQGLPGILPEEISFIYTDGHTPGHLHTLFRGPQQTVFFCGDLVPGTSWLHVPITMGYDRFPERLIDEKQDVYGRAVTENWLLFFTHDPQFAASFCTKTPENKFVVRNPMKDLRRMPI